MPAPADLDTVRSPGIILATLNAKYIHASLGLRCLLANMDLHGGAGLRAQTVLREFVIQQKPTQIVEDLLALDPKVIGLGIYIWNVVETTQVVRLLKALRPDVKIVLGGPEVSFEVEQQEICRLADHVITGLGIYIWNVVETTQVVRLLKALRPDVKIVLGGPEVSFEVEQQEICRLADHVITGWGDVSFPKLCRALIDGPQPLMKVIAGEQPPLAELALPYSEYTAEDLAKRLLYVEASRGCPFKCEFCLSALDKTAWAFDLDLFISEVEALYQRGARNFKFVDRTFNLKIDNSVRILQFFLDRIAENSDVFVHFEVVPDSLPDRLKALIAQFPAGALQFEVGIQSFNAEVQQRVSRKQDNDKTADNLRWLVNESRAHVHADLIFGLPGETLASFTDGFDRLYDLAPHEIQFGILKRLRGTPITRHTAEFGMVYDPQTPYTILQNSTVDFATLQRVNRFARYWDMVANSGRFSQALNLLLQPGSAFGNFMNFSDWLYQATGKTHEFSYEKLVDLLHDHLTEERGLAVHDVCSALLADYTASGARGKPECLASLLAQARGAVPTGAGRLRDDRRERQGRHVSQQAHRDEIQKAAAAA